MRRATTPSIEIEIDQSLIDAEYRVTFAQRNGPRIVKDQDACTLSEDGKLITVPLSQEETLRFSDRYNIQVQVRYKVEDRVCGTNIVSTNIGEILDEEVI